MIQLLASISIQHLLLKGTFDYLYPLHEAPPCIKRPLLVSRKGGLLIQIFTVLVMLLLGVEWPLKSYFLCKG